LLFGLLVGCSEFPAGWGDLRIWAVPGTEPISPTSEPVPESPVFSATANTVHLEGAVNEVVAFQMILKSEGGPATVTDIALTSLQWQDSRISSENIKLHRAGWIKVTDYPTWYLRLTPNLGMPREFADPLIPLDAPRGGLPMEILPTRCALVWAEIRIPPGTPAGVYQGKIRVSRSSGFARELKMQLRVLPFALPQTRHLSVVTGLNSKELLRHHLEVDGKPYVPGQISFEDPAYKRITSCLDATARLLHEHRCEPVAWDIEPHRHYGTEGQLQLGWSDYDRLVGGLLDGSVFENRVGVEHWPIPLRNDSPPPAAFGGWGSGQFADFLQNYLRLCGHHFEEHGWFDRQFIWCPPPGSSRAKRYAMFAWLGRQVQETDERLRLFCPLTPNSLRPYGALQDGWENVSEWVDIWCPPASLVDFEALAEQRKRAKSTWLRPDRLPFAGSMSVIAPATSSRSLGWLAYRFGLQGLMLAEVNNWDGMRHDLAAGSEQALIWPGKPFGLERPIPSIRLKRLMRGLQDYEYLWLLEQNARPGIAQRLANDLVPFGGSSCYVNHFLDSHPHGLVLDSTPWRLARRIMARELEEILGQGESPGITDDFARFEEKVDWSWFSSQVRQVHLMIEGINISTDPNDREKPVRLRATVWLLNATRNAVRGRLAFVNLPDGWEMTKPLAEIEHLPPLQSVRKVVQAKAPPFNPGRLGNHSIEIALLQSKETPENYQPLCQGQGRLAVLVSQRMFQTPVIDGKLDDWAVASANVAGDFILMGAQDVPKSGQDRPTRMSQATTAYVCHDDKYLYIAFNCKDRQQGRGSGARSNYVRYDGLWPRGEDLVEVVLDPLHQAVDSSDLYHLVVKANGATISERGVPCLAGVSEHDSWSANVQAAVDRESEPGQWTVEIRLPLEGLGERDGIWGINFARLDEARGEYGSWSGARRYLYDPASLGNLRLGR